MKVTSVVHEYGSNGQHRIILTDEAGELHPGNWAGFMDLAQNRGYLAATEYYNGALPSGVFQVRSVAHKTITG